MSSDRSWIRVALPLFGVLAAAFVFAVVGDFAGDAIEPGRDAVDSAPADPTASDASVDRAASADAAPAHEDAGARVDAAWRYDDRGRLMRPPGEGDAIRCVQPAVEIPMTPGCESGAPYPGCRWQLPEPGAVEMNYVIWRNTTDDHRFARPGLVSLLLATAAEYARRWPGEHLTIGDLDAPGPRHQTHDRGVDVDLYLEEAMIARNDGGRRYPDNYAGKSRREVRALRARCMDLAQILATCAGGQIRIYYNDPDLVRPFREWFDAQGMRSDVGRPMRQHNDLHRFHFHLTVPEELDVQPTSG